MGILSTGARSSLARINKRPDLPGWWPVMQIGVVVLVLLAVAFQIMSGKSFSPKAQPATKGGYISVDAANQGSRGTTQGAGEAMTTMPVAGSASTAKVSSEAVAVAILASSAIFTGDSTDLPIAQGSVFVPPAKPGHVSLLSLSVVHQSSSLILFTARVDLGDGVGAHQLALTVVKQDANWNFLPAA